MFCQQHKSLVWLPRGTGQFSFCNGEKAANQIGIFLFRFVDRGENQLSTITSDKTKCLHLLIQNYLQSSKVRYKLKFSK